MDIDSISEVDVLNALNGVSQKKSSSDEMAHIESKKTKSLEIDEDSIDKISMLLKELVKNKTIEISIKIKD